MAQEPTYQDLKREAQKHLIDLGYANNFDAHNAPGLTDNNKFKLALDKYKADQGIQRGTSMDDVVKRLRGDAETLRIPEAIAVQAPAPAQPKPLETPAPAAANPAPAAQAPQIDPDIQKAQGYMRALGIAEVEIDGQKQEVKVDGLNSPVTSAALAKYRADNGFDNNDNFSTVLGHMEGRIKQNPPGVQQFMSQTMADGQLAGGPNIMAMQLLMNLLAPLIQMLSGGKINPEQLKVDGINGPRTTNAYNGYNTTMNNNDLKANGPATPQQADADPLGAFADQKLRESDARMAATPAQPSPEIRVRPGESTRGVAAREGVIPTVVVDGPQPVIPGSRPALQVDGGLEAGSTGGSYARAPRAYAGDTGRYQQRSPGYGEMRQQYNTASGAEVRDRMLQQRAELRETGYSPRDVKAIVRDNRVQELEGSGMNRRAALNQANIETRMVDNVERGFAREDRAYDRAMRQEQAAYGRAMRAEDRDITRFSRDFGKAAGILTDRSARNDHQATRILAGAGIEAVLRGGIPGMGAGGARGGYGMERTPGIVADGGVIVSGGRGGAYGGSREYGRMVQQEDRDITRISRDFGRAAGIMTDRNPRNDHQATRILAGAGIEGVLRGGIPGMGVGGARGGFGMGGGGNPISALMSAITGGNSQTYAAQPLARGAYAGYDRGNAREWNGNQIRPEFDGARSYGNTADPRMALAAVREQQIMAADQPQTPQERMAEQRRLQEIYSPG